ncbi:uncharacterized protein [Eurosta solidaginis]|uniref:uncharacterized protein isoform X2 n=1 Tax=Eurosta solidaginis TaxID=178769 RepID=UPI003530D050
MELKVECSGKIGSFSSQIFWWDISLLCYKTKKIIKIKLFWLNFLIKKKRKHVNKMIKSGEIISKTDIMAHQKVVRETKVLIKRVHKMVARITGESGDNLHTDIAEMLPMKTLDAVFDFEEKMEDKNFEDVVITYFFAVKGASGDLCGVVKQIFSDDVLALFNWSGGNNKTALSKLKIVHIALFEIFKLLGRLTFKNDLSEYITLSHNRCKQRRYLKNKK